MPKKLVWNWEKIDEFEQNATFRAKVIGGWLVRHKSYHAKLGLSETMCFVPDRDHEWVIISPVTEEKPIATKLVDAGGFKASGK